MQPDDKTSVRVAVRVRPLSDREKAEFQKTCLTVADHDPQIVIGTERAFTFDHTFHSDTEQEAIFEATTKDLVEGCFDGYNATILAYGQTGSGKTYTMGTGFDVTIPDHVRGLIPRAVHHIFAFITIREEECLAQNLSPPVFDIWVQFIELYQDDIIDLLDRATSKKGQKKRTAHAPKLGEDKNGNVILTDVCTMQVDTKEKVMDWLKQGALARTTGSTNMNAQSSRSHAIFTIGIRQSRALPQDENDPNPQFLTTSAKFHFVDLAGSERLKRTQATGTRAKESISINSGLLALGNVICKLGDKSLKATHIPYRSSKLTRLLQDSLGGNSRTMMIACISPAEQDFMETLNTLRYANRTRNIKNKVAANQDTDGATAALLRARCQELEMQLLEYQQGKRQPGVDAYNDMFIENNALQKDNEALRARIKILADQLAEKEARNVDLRSQLECLKAVADTGGDVLMSNAPNQNLTDGDKMALHRHYAKLLEEAEERMRKKEEEWERVLTSSRSPPLSPHKTLLGCGGSTYRVKRRPPSDEKQLDGYDFPTALDDSIMDGQPSLQDMLTDEGEADLAVLALDEEIKDRERKLEEMVSELSQTKESYEAKIQQLTSRIQEVETERNTYLKESRAKPSLDPEKIREREQKYQHELDELKKKLKEQQTLLVENKRLSKDNNAFVGKVAVLETEIKSLKKTRCDVMKKIEKDGKLARQRDLEQSRVLSQKDKESRCTKTENAKLKCQLLQFQSVINRLRSDLTAARNSQKKAMSDLVAGRVAKPSQQTDEAAWKAAWDEFEKNFRVVAYKRATSKSHEKELEAYNTEVKRLRETLAKLEKKLGTAVEKGETRHVENIRRELDDNKVALRFVSQKFLERQNEIVACVETAEECDLMDPVYLRSKFPDEPSSRYFTERLLELCQSQSEAIRTLEKTSRTKEEEYRIIRKERDAIREILQFYIIENPTQAKGDIVGLVPALVIVLRVLRKQRFDREKKLPEDIPNDLRSHLEDQGLDAEEVISGIMTASPSTPRTKIPKTKARNFLPRPEEMLVANGSDGSMSASSSSSFRSESESHSEVERISPADSVDSAKNSIFRKPFVPTKTLLQDQRKRLNEGRLGIPPPVPPLIVSGTGLTSTPSKSSLNLNRSVSSTEIANTTSTRNTSNTALSSGHSLEHVAAPSTPSPKLQRRHPCHTNLVSASLRTTPVPAQNLRKY